MWTTPAGSDRDQTPPTRLDAAELAANLDRQVRALEQLRDLGVLSVDEFRTHYATLLARY